MDACEDPRHEQEDPCPWPYTLASGCRRTFGESAGSGGYDAFNALFAALSFALLLVIVRRVIRALIDVSMLKNERAKRIFGSAPRSKKKLNSYDQSYIILSYILAVICFLSVDLHAWRDVLPVQLYRTVRSSANYAGFSFVVLLVDHYITVSYIMAADVVTPSLNARATRSIGHRMMKCFTYVLFLCWLSALPAFFHRVGPEGTEDARLQNPQYYAANVMLVVVLVYGTYSTYRILSYLQDAMRRDMESAYSNSKSSMPNRVERRRKGIARTRNIFAAAIVIAVLEMLYTFRNVRGEWNDRAMSLRTPCGALSLFDPPMCLLVVMGVFAVAFGPTRETERRADRYARVSTGRSSDTGRRNTLRTSIARRFSSFDAWGGKLVASLPRPSAPHANAAVRPSDTPTSEAKRNSGRSTAPPSTNNEDPPAAASQSRRDSAEAALARYGAEEMLEGAPRAAEPAGEAKGAAASPRRQRLVLSPRTLQRIEAEGRRRPDEVRDGDGDGDGGKGADGAPAPDAPPPPPPGES